MTEVIYELRKICMYSHFKSLVLLNYGKSVEKDTRKIYVPRELPFMKLYTVFLTLDLTRATVSFPNEKKK